MIGDFVNTRALKITNHYGKLQLREIVIPRTQIEEVIRAWLYEKKLVPVNAKWSMEWFEKYDEEDHDHLVEEGLIVVLKVEEMEDPKEAKA